jgi:hypothetical protein
VARTVRGSNNAHNAQITHPVEPTVSAPRAYPAAIAERGNAQTAQVTYLATASNHLPDQYEEYWEDTPAEYASEGSTVYVGNLPYHIDDESLALSFEHAGVIVFYEVSLFSSSSSLLALWYMKHMPQIHHRHEWTVCFAICFISTVFLENFISTAEMQLAGFFFLSLF